MSEAQSYDITPVHNCVPGRGRWLVPGLKGSGKRCKELKRVLEHALLQKDGVLEARASTASGNLLVKFNHATHCDVVVDYIAQALENREGYAAELPAAAGKAKKKLNLNFSSKRAREVEYIPPDGNGNGKSKGPDWHMMSIAKVAEKMDSDALKGLAVEIAADRLVVYGPNAGKEIKPKPAVAIFAEQFLSLPVALLGAAAALSVVTGGVLDAAIIIGVTAANGFIGFFTERESEKTISALQKIDLPPVPVIRGGEKTAVPVEAVVPGDVLLLTAGTYVAADARIIEANRLSIDESSLTGESLPVEKTEKALRKKEVPLAARKNMAYKGTVVTGGFGAALVTSTGRKTEIGILEEELLGTETPRPPIERDLTQTGDTLVKLCGAVCAAVFGVGIVRGYAVVEMLRMAVSLAAAAVPEGLPAAATTTFTLGIRDMRKHRVLIRKLQAVETLGSVGTVCFDKTGTITENRMSVTRVYTGMRRLDRTGNVFRAAEAHDAGVDVVKLPELRELFTVCMLCSELEMRNGETETTTSTVDGSATERALYRAALRLGVNFVDLHESHKELSFNPRSENRPLMSASHRRDDGTIVHTAKGSPMDILDMCDHHMKDGKVQPLSDEERNEIEMYNERMAGDALRVLGTAMKPSDNGESKVQESGFIWLGLVGMADPVRPGVADLIKVFHKAGIRTVMITGDQSATAYAVAKELNLSRGEPLEILDSTELTSIDEDMLTAIAKKVHVFSRVSPSHKLRIVKALQNAGQITAMTGDGINDGPALKAADVGIAMGGGGTDVAREVADVVLENDDLDTLIRALADGRTTYINIKKSVHFFLATNFSEIMVASFAMTAGMGAPLSAMQLLWINIISDIFPGLALSLEAPEPEILDRPPRNPDDPLFSKDDYKVMGVEAGIISAAALGSYVFGMSRYGAGPRAGALCFQSLTFAQLLHAVSCRSERHTIMEHDGIPPNKWLNIALGGSLALQGLTLVVPGLKRILGIGHLGPLDLAVSLGSASLSLVANETVKRARLSKTA